MVADQTINAALMAPFIVVAFILILGLVLGAVSWRNGKPPNLPSESTFGNRRKED